MKEQYYFYTPQVQDVGELAEEEAQHALRVLRMSVGDELMLMDGRGTFYRAAIRECTRKRCGYRVLERLPQERLWRGRLHLAMAPTKNMDRTEWLAEKATEIGLDELTFLNCRFSERKVIKAERIEKIIVAAMKQSRKPWMPVLHPMTSFEEFIVRPWSGGKYICHCYETGDGQRLGSKPWLPDLLQPEEDALVLIGPEGDFSIEEVEAAERAGFRSVSLGNSRLRTETAALVAVHLMNLSHALHGWPPPAGNVGKNEFPEKTD